jgi:hypothetical protein
MVEDHRDLYHFVIASPPDVFDAAILARTIYTSLGVHRWKLFIAGLGSKPPLRFILDSRLPLSVIKERLVFGAYPDHDYPTVLVVDPRGKPIDSVDLDKRSPTLVVIDYTGSYVATLSDVQRVSALGLSVLTYEAVATIYALARKASSLLRGRPSPVYEGTLNLREAIYIARKLAEVLRIVDSYPFIDVNALGYVVRNVFLARKLLAEVDRAELEYRPASFRARLHIKLYSLKSLREAGSLELVIDNEAVELLEDRKPILRLHVDYDRRVVCIAKDLCLKPGRGEEVLVQLPRGFEIEY